MWSVQEQEDRDYQMGAAGELQNALAWSMMNRRPDDSGRIAELVNAGFFVVVEEGTEYCPSTDAIMGSRKLVDSVHNSRGAAELAIAGYGDDFDPEVDVYVMPREYRTS